MAGGAAPVYEFKASPYSSHSRLLALLPAPGSGRRVLDLGCGNGYLGAILAQRGYEVTGVERAGGYDASFPRAVRLIEADLENGLPPLTGPYDYILCADILEHLRDPERLLRRLPGLLAERGAVVASLPNSGHLYFRLQVLAGRFPQHDRGLFDRTHLRFYTWDGWVGLFRRAGLDWQRVEPTGTPVGLAVPAWEGSPGVKAAEWLAYVAARAWKRLMAYQFVVAARPASAMMADTKGLSR